MRRCSILAVIALAMVLSPRPTTAGSYSGIAECSRTSGCALGVPKSDPTQEVTPFGITHPLGYTGIETAIQIRICVDSDSPRLEGPTQRAIATWNALAATTENCESCVLWEDPPAPAGKYHAESAILHELGHCAMALDHIDRFWDVEGDGFFENTSFTLSANALHPGGLDDGDDDIRGSLDDFHTSPVGGQPADSVSWFRIADNNPLIVDGTVIDINTFSRSVTANLPPGHTWAASGNRLVGESLSLPDTQAAMYSLYEPEQRYTGLSADDVNMVRMGMTGEDLVAGTKDDYTIELLFVEDCASGHDVQIRFDDTLPAGTVGVCDRTDIDYSFPPANPLLARHFSVVPLFAGLNPEVLLNESLDWNTGGPDLVLTKDDGGVTVDPGDTIVYVLSLSNVGDEDATGVEVSETVPEGTTLVAGASDPLWVCGDVTAGSSCTLDAGTVVVDAPVVTFNFAVQVDDPTSVAEVTNVASVTDDGMNGDDNDPLNNVAVDTTPVDVPCNGVEDLVLTDPLGDPVVVHEACNSITAGTNFLIVSGRDVTFKVRNLLVLENGFGVESAAVFRGVLDPLAGQTAGPDPQ